LKGRIRIREEEHKNCELDHSEQRRLQLLKEEGSHTGGLKYRTQQFRADHIRREGTKGKEKISINIKLESSKEVCITYYDMKETFKQMTQFSMRTKHKTKNSTDNFLLHFISSRCRCFLSVAIKKTTVRWKNYCFNT
jgi:hypothetical protein